MGVQDTILGDLYLLFEGTDMWVSLDASPGLAASEPNPGVCVSTGNTREVLVIQPVIMNQVAHIAAAMYFAEPLRQPVS